MCVKSNGVLGGTVANFKGLFDTLKCYGIRAKDVVKIIDLLPEFSLQNKRDMMDMKIKLIQQESGRDIVYIRNFIKRHPDIVLK